jgi:hypothetical protein
VSRRALALLLAALCASGACRRRGAATIEEQ